MQLHQTSHSRLLALPVNSNKIELSAKLFQIYQKLQSEGITLSNEKASIYFNLPNNENEIDIQYVGMEVLDIIKVDHPFEFIDFKPEFCFSKIITSNQNSFDISFLNEYCQKMKKELIKEKMKPSSRGRLSFNWHSWSDESDIELCVDIFSVIKED